MRKLIVTAFMLFLTACGSLQTLSYDQQLAAANTGLTAVVNLVAAAHERGAISTQDAVEARQLAVNAATVLDSAKTLADQGDTLGSRAKYELAIAVLDELERYLAARGVQ